MTAARTRDWIPDSAFFAIWSSSAFLFYLGTLVILFSVLWLLETLNGGGSNSGLVGWTSLVLGVIALAAGLLRRSGWAILAGLAAFIGLIVFAAWVGSIFDWIGFKPDEGNNSFFLTHFEPSLLAFEALVVLAGLWAIRVFRFPLLVLPVALTAWFGFVDNASFVTADRGNDAHAVVAIGAGVLLIAAAVWLDRSGHAPYAFWLHFVGSLSIGGGVLALLGNDDWAWALGGLISLGYVGAARVFARSNYAVIGAIGVLVVGSYFIEKWYSFISIPFIVPGHGGDDAKWRPALSYIVLGLILAALGVLVDRGSRLRGRPVPARSP